MHPLHRTFVGRLLQPHMVEPEPNVPVSLHKYLKRLQDSFPMAVAKRFIDVDVLTQAASVSFYALLSMAPLLVLLLG
jgi:membrane protein